MARPSGQKRKKPSTISAIVAGVHAGRIIAVFVMVCSVEKRTSSSKG
ncbi:MULTISPECIES: hypothetical protein [Brucella]|nr:MULTISPECIES: hypothetical protein [Brucella]AEQ09632.1 hypothetical protein BMNI_I2013 [Brucella melitensis NI]MCG7675428.1 hypothetical protein [Brucella melitensis]